MRLLANENFPGVAITALRLRGHDVVWIREDSPGISDHDVLSRATAEGRVLIQIVVARFIGRIGAGMPLPHPLQSYPP